MGETPSRALNMRTGGRRCDFRPTDMQATFGWQVHSREKMSHEATVTKTRTHTGDTRSRPLNRRRRIENRRGDLHGCWASGMCEGEVEREGDKASH
jgi:hypothetical protein